MFYFPSPQEGLARLQAIIELDRRRWPAEATWYVGTSEYERKAREAEQELRDALSAEHDAT